MPVCPKCKWEYRPGVSTCPDCGSALVDEGPSESPPRPRPEDEEAYRQVLLCVVQGEIHARILQNALVAESIPSRIQVGGEDQFMVTLPAGQSVFPSGASTLMQVWVRKGDLGRARAIYRAYEGEGQ